MATADHHGASNIRIIGSVARGEADEASDLDLLVDLERGRSLMDPGGLQADLDSQLNMHVDVATGKMLRAGIRDRVLSEAVPPVRDDRAPLRDVLEAIDRVQIETAAGPDAFRDDLKLQVWVLYHLQIAGEACRGLSEPFRKQSPDPVWSKATGLRNILVHYYFEID